MAIQDVIKRLIYQFTSTGADKVADDIGKVNTEQTKLAASTPQVTKASLDLSKSFENLERRFDSTIRAQQDYAKVQDKVNAAVAQNPALQERANSVLALAAQHFDKAGKSTSAYATAVDQARGAAVGLAAGIGPLGAVLGSFGPWGVAAAAGIGLVTHAFTYLRESAAKMGDEAVKLGQLSDISGLTTAQVRGLTEAGQELGVGADAIAGALGKFTVNLDAARKGSGDLYEQLRDIDKQLAIQIGATRSTSEALDLLAKAYNATADATTKAAMSRAAFGKGGLSVGPVLGVLSEAGGVDKYSKAAAEALGVTDDWTQSVRKLQNQVKDLKGDIETMKGGIFAKQALEAELALLQAEYEIIKKSRDAAKAPGTPLLLGDFGTGNVVPFATSQASISGEAGRAGMIRDTEAATKALEENERALRDNDLAMKEVAATSQNLVAALGAGATAAEKEAARVDALTAAFLANKFGARESAEAIETYRRAVAANPAVLAAEKATQQMEKQNELAKARNIEEEKRIASQQAYDQVIKEIGDTEAGRAAANARSSAVEESYRIKIKAHTAEAAAKARELQNAFNETVFSAQALADATDIIAENTARAAKTAADFARAMQLGTFAPTTMPTGQHTFVGGAEVSYRGGGTGKILDVAGGKPAVLAAAEASYMARYGLTTVDPTAASAAIIDAMQSNTASIDELKDSTDTLNATNQELLSPYYTQDPRTSHIGFRSQGMAAGGYVDVPGGYSANDNLLAMIPVASGERIHVDPMTSKRGGAGATTINISVPMTFTGNVDANEVGRTVYQTMQTTARQIRSAQR